MTGPGLQVAEAGGGRSLLEVSELSVSFPSSQAAPPAVDGVSLSLEAGELLALVGESGAGKTTVILSLLGLLPAAAQVGGSAVLDGRELLGLAERELRRLRGAQMALVPQDPGGALDPLMRIGSQVAEQIRAHEDVSRSAARDRASQLLARVGLDEPERVARSYPHEMSGGMRQRAAIAMAISCRPRLLLCDEPTSALDRLGEARLLDLLERLRAEDGLGVLLVTHDLGVVARAADRVAVMLRGAVVEEGTAEDVLSRPRHAFSAELLDAMPWVEESDDPRASVHSLPRERREADAARQVEKAGARGGAP